MIRSLFAIVVVTGFVASAPLLAEEESDLAGFSGRVRGVVSGRTDGGFVKIHVSKLLKVWKGNEATEPWLIEDRTVTVGPRWVKGDGGKWHAVERHVRFLAKLEAGKVLDIELRYSEKGRFEILELSKAQREGADAEEPDRDRTEEKKAAPEGLAGFSGRVRGHVTGKDDRGGFALKVARLLDVWKDNEAEKAESIVGRTVPVGPRWEKRDDGKWHPVEAHVRFIARLEKGDEITVEIRHAERDRFAILELSEDQRKALR